MGKRRKRRRGTRRGRRRRKERKRGRSARRRKGKKNKKDFHQANVNCGYSSPIIFHCHNKVPETSYLKERLFEVTVPGPVTEREITEEGES